MTGLAPGCAYTRHDVDRIVEEVSAETRVPASEILGTSRKRLPAQARHAAIYRVRKELGWPLSAIGAHFHRDHTSVLNAIRRVEGRLAE